MSSHDVGSPPALASRVCAKLRQRKHEEEMSGARLARLRAPVNEGDAGEGVFAPVREALAFLSLCDRRGAESGFLTIA